MIIRNGSSEFINWTDGYECTGAYANAEEAIKKLPALKPDVALIDIGLPGKSGIELVIFIHEKYSLNTLHDVHGL